MLSLPNDVIKLLNDIKLALDANGDGGAKITPEEWAKIGVDLGIVALDVVKVAK